MRKEGHLNHLLSDVRKRAGKKRCGGRNADPWLPAGWVAVLPRCGQVAAASLGAGWARAVLYKGSAELNGTGTRAWPGEEVTAVLGQRQPLEPPIAPQSPLEPSQPPLPRGSAPLRCSVMLGLLGTAPVFAARCPWGCFGQMPAAQEPARMCSFVLCPTHNVACSSSAVGAGRVHRRSLCSAAVRVTSSLTLKTPPPPLPRSMGSRPLHWPLGPSSKSRVPGKAASRPFSVRSQGGGARGCHLSSGREPGSCQV